MAEIDPLQEVIYHCPFCMEAFMCEDAIKQHLDNHATERPYECSLCAVRFISKLHLEKHFAKKHGKETYYEACPVCGKLFHDKINLRSHMAVHSDDRPYVCSVCNKGFKRKGELDSHSVTHSGVKPFKCTKCNKGFTQKYNMKTHMRTHTGEKPFKCTKCGKEFNRISTVRMHMRTHTNERPYQCTKCHENFKFLRDRNKHMLKVHEQPQVNAQEKESGLIKLSVKGLQQQVAEQVALKSGLDIKGNNNVAKAEKRAALKSGRDMKGKYECAICREEFTLVTEFNDHIKTHDVDTCFLCGQKLKTKIEKRRHVTRPIEMENSECFTCGLQFKTLEKFKEHMAGHSALCRLEECLNNAEHLHKMSKRLSENKQNEADGSSIVKAENDDVWQALEDIQESYDADDVAMYESEDSSLQKTPQKTGCVKKAEKFSKISKASVKHEKGIKEEDEARHPETAILELEAVSDEASGHHNLRICNVTSTEFRSVQSVSPGAEKAKVDPNTTSESQERKKSVFKVGRFSPPRTRRFMKLKGRSIEKGLESNRASSESNNNNIEPSPNENCTDKNEEDSDDCDLAESYSIYVRNMLRLQPVEKQMALIKSINTAIAQFISD